MDIKRILRYGIIGVFTTIINIFIDMGLRYIKVPYIISITIAWLAAVLFAYYANKNYVFQNKTASKITLFLQFISSRVFTLFLEYGITYICVSILNFNQTLVKFGAQFIIIILNYILGNKIFSKKNNGG